VFGFCNSLASDVNAQLQTLALMKSKARFFGNQSPFCTLSIYKRQVV